ncbi:MULTISPECIES: hypothetical protein [unclassified Pseudofrankia]|uniref:hypothetical protein n=1 Tax=unclassified Pseudofrankia TaxID=2994372 RepID=UPI0010423331|nr:MULTISPECIES: hypothetical protein [unclassified Pseudofrankia]MDT3442668.1 hypothetical protein [Pseudofrankia sp. BMG5.37]
MTSPARRTASLLAVPRVGVRSLVLVGAVLLGILLMHGGLGTHLGAGIMMESRAGMAPASGEVGMAPPAPALLVSMAPDPAPTQHADHDVGLAGAAMTLTAIPGHDGHTGELCLAVLRSVVLFAGLLLVLLFVGVRGGEAQPGPLAAGRGRLRYLSRPTGPLLSALCVLRL